MTIEFIFHLPSRSSEPPLKILTHRNSLAMTLRKHVERNMKENSKMKKDASFVEWLIPLISLDNNAVNSPLCIIRASEADSNINAQRMDLTSSRTSAYHKLDWNHKLASSLKFKHFVEFPTIEVMEEDAFKGTLIDEDGVHLETVEVKSVKRRRLDPEAAQKTLKGLIGGYGSGSEDEYGAVPASMPILTGYDEADMDDDALEEELVDDENAGEDGPIGSGLPPSMSIEELQALIMQRTDTEALDPDELAELREDELTLANLHAAIQQ